MAPAEAATSQGACCTSATVDPRLGTPWDRDSNRADDKITFVGGGNELPLWGPVPEGTVRGGPVAARGTPVELQRWRSAPGFRRRYHLASSTGGIETVLDLDEQGQQIALPLVP
jgi:hypothetical protein